MRKITLAALLMSLGVLSGCVVGPDGYPGAYNGMYYTGAPPYETYGYDPMFYGTGYYPRDYRRGGGAYNWGGWHHGGAAGAHAGGFHGGAGHGGGGGHAGGGHGGGGGHR